MATCSINACDRTTVGRGWCRRHYHRWVRYGDPEGGGSYHGDTSARFWSKVEQETDGCWRWVGSLDSDGYGRLRVSSHGNGTGSTALVHRWAYEQFVGPIPEGLHLDHLCRVRNCVNPAHLEPVTPGENTRRSLSGINMASKTHCPRGHAYAGDNVYVDPQRKRHCRTCHREAARRHREKKTHD